MPLDLGFLRTRNVEVLVAGFREVVSVFSHPADQAGGAAELARHFFDASPLGDELLQLWEWQIQHDVRALAVLVPRTIANLLHHAKDGVARPAARGLSMRLLEAKMPMVYRCLGDKDTKLVIATLELLTAVNAVDPACAQEMADRFPFGGKPIRRLLGKERGAAARGGSSTVHSGSNARTALFLFALSFLEHGDIATKRKVLEMRDFFEPLMAALATESDDVVRRCVGALHHRVVADRRLERSFKVRFFTARTLGHLARIYRTACPDDVLEELHSMMLQLCLSKTFGISFPDRAWYATRGKHAIRNIILAQFVRGLRADEDTLQADLLYHILREHRELIPLYWSSFSPDGFSRRSSSAWLLNLALALRILDLPFPAAVADDGAEVPVVAEVVHSLLPVPLRRAELTKWLHAGEPLPVFMAASFISAVLGKTSCLLRDVSAHSSVPWKDFRTDLVDMLARELPDLQVITAALARSHRNVLKVDGRAGAANAALVRLLRDYFFFLGAVDSRTDLRKMLPGNKHMDGSGPLEHTVLQALLIALDGRWHSSSAGEGARPVRLFLDASAARGNASSARELARILLLACLRSSPAFEGHDSEVFTWIDALSLVPQSHLETVLDFLDEGVAELSGNSTGAAAWIGSSLWSERSLLWRWGLQRLLQDFNSGRDSRDLASCRAVSGYLRTVHVVLGTSAGGITPLEPYFDDLMSALPTKPAPRKLAELLELLSARPSALKRRAQSDREHVGRPLSRAPRSASGPSATREVFAINLRSVAHHGDVVPILGRAAIICSSDRSFLPYSSLNFNDMGCSEAFDLLALRAGAQRKKMSLEVPTPIFGLKPSGDVLARLAAYAFADDVWSADWQVKNPRPLASLQRPDEAWTSAKLYCQDALHCSIVGEEVRVMLGVSATWKACRNRGSLVAWAISRPSHTVGTGLAWLLQAESGSDCLKARLQYASEQHLVNAASLVTFRPISTVDQHNYHDSGSISRGQDVPSGPTFRSNGAAWTLGSASLHGLGLVGYTGACAACPPPINRAGEDRPPSPQEVDLAHKAFLDGEASLASFGSEMLHALDDPAWSRVRAVPAATWLQIRSTALDRSVFFACCRDRLHIMQQPSVLSLKWQLNCAIRVLHVALLLHTRGPPDSALADVFVGPFSLILAAAKVLKLDSARVAFNVLIDAIAAGVNSMVDLLGHVLAGADKTATRLLTHNDLLARFMDAAVVSQSLDITSATALGRLLWTSMTDATSIRRLSNLLGESPSLPSFMVLLGSSLSAFGYQRKLGPSQKSHGLVALVDVASALLLLYPRHPRSAVLVDALGRCFCGTANPVDRRILAVFKTLEDRFHTSVRHAMLAWERLQVPVAGSRGEYEDPRLAEVVLPLVAELTEGTIPWRSVIRDNRLGFVLLQLSSARNEERRAALAVLDRVFANFEDAIELREHRQIAVVLDSVRNALAVVDEEVPPRIPTVVASFASHALHIALHPDHELYVGICKFFLQRPVLDLTDIPMLYELFYASDENHRYKRRWILQLLASGVVASDDYAPYRRRHVLELLMGHFLSTMADQVEREWIVRAMFQLASIPGVAAALLDTGWPSWILHVVRQERPRVPEGLVVGLCRTLVTALRNAMLHGGGEQTRPSKDIFTGSLTRTVALLVFWMKHRTLGREIGQFERCLAVQVVAAAKHVVLRDKVDLCGTAKELAFTVGIIVSRCAVVDAVKDYASDPRASDSDLTSESLCDVNPLTTPQEARLVEDAFDVVLVSSAPRDEDEGALVRVAKWACEAFSRWGRLRYPLSRTKRFSSWLSMICRSTSGWTRTLRPEDPVRLALDSMVAQLGAVSVESRS